MSHLLKRKLVVSENHVSYGVSTIDDDGVTSANTSVEFSKIEFHASASTTNASGTEIASIEIPNFTTMNISVVVVARRTGGSAGTDEDGLAYTMIGAFKSVAGTATQIGSTVVVADIKDQLSWDVQFITIAKNAKIYVAGAVNNNIDWVCYYKLHFFTSL